MKTKATEVQPTHTDGTETVGVRFQSSMLIIEDDIISFSDKGEGIGLGEILDRQLTMLAKHGGRPNSFKFEFDEAAWEKAKPFYLAKAEAVDEGRHWN